MAEVPPKDKLGAIDGAYEESSDGEAEDAEIGLEAEMGINQAIEEEGYYDESAAVNGAPSSGISDPQQDQTRQALQRSAIQQQQDQQQQANSQIPDAVKSYILHFHQAVQNGDISAIASLYEFQWNRLTEKFYKGVEWPDTELIAPLVKDDQVFLTLYRELFYRHIYGRLTPSVEDRFHSYENYCDLFNFILNSETPVALELPAAWLWDIIDEFIYQFQVFAIWRNKTKNKQEDEIALMMENSTAWSSYSVLNVLYSLVQKSKINEQLAAQRRGSDIDDAAGAYGARQLYRMLGYFSIIGLVRVHVLLGDYTLALKMLDEVELNKRSPFARVTAAHVTTYYYVGFCYIVLRRYGDAIKILTHILLYILRLKHYQTRGYQFDQINKKSDQMYALLAMCISLHPTKLDENIQNNLREKYGEPMSRMSKGDAEALKTFEDLFYYACPKFISPNGPDYENPQSIEAFARHPDPHVLQSRIFSNNVRTGLCVPTLRSYLRLYTTIGVSKLASFLDNSISPDVDKSGEDENDAAVKDSKEDQEDLLRQQLLIFKQRTTHEWKWQSGSLLSGNSAPIAIASATGESLDYVLDADDNVHVIESRLGRRYGDWFIRNSARASDILASLKSRPLPIGVANGAQMNADYKRGGLSDRGRGGSRAVRGRGRGMSFVST